MSFDIYDSSALSCLRFCIVFLPFISSLCIKMSFALERKLMKINKRILRLETKLAPLIAKRKAIKKELDKAVRTSIMTKDMSSDSASTTSSTSSSESTKVDKKKKKKKTCDGIGGVFVEENKATVIEEAVVPMQLTVAPTVIEPPEITTPAVVSGDGGDGNSKEKETQLPSTAVASVDTKVRAGRPGVSYAGKCVKCARIAKGLTGNGVAHVSGCSLYNPRGRNAA